MIDETSGGGSSNNASSPVSQAAAAQGPTAAAAAAAAYQRDEDPNLREQEQQQQQQQSQQQQQPQQQGGKRRRVDSAAEREASPLAGEASEPGASCFYDTVGCVVLAPDGSVAAGVSSGGILLKTEGRVGEAAAFGAGCWAQNGRPGAPAEASGVSPQPLNGQQQLGAAERLGAAPAPPALACSVTGVGEAVMRHLLARDCCTEAVAAAEAAGRAAAAAAADAPTSSAAADGSGTEDGEAPAAASEMPMAQLAAALLQRTVLRGPPPHDCGLLCLKAQPIEEAPAVDAPAAAQQNGGACGSAQGEQRRQAVRYAVEVSVAHCAQSMAFGHLACAQASSSGGSGAAGRAPAPAVIVLRRQAGCSGRPAPAVQTYTHGTTLLL